jgi:hypothetical protein
MRCLLLSLALFIVLVCGGGCSPAKKKEPMEMEKVPESVMKIAKEKLPDVTFERAFREPNGDYELMGKDKKGKVREIDISPAGVVTQIE